MKSFLLLPLVAVLGLSQSSAQEGRRLAPSARDGAAPRDAEQNSPRMRPMAFLGVATSPVPPAMAAQLGLPEGFGLVVDRVMPDSPAGKAGVQRFDVLRRFNDQLLTDPGQLAALVRAQGRSEEVSLTLLRKGEEQRVGVKLSERPMPERPPGQPREGALREPMDRMKAEAGENARRMQEKAREFNQRLREFQERLQKWRANPEGEMPRMPELNPPGGPEASRREARPDGEARGDRRPDGEANERRRDGEGRGERRPDGEVRERRPDGEAGERRTETRTSSTAKVVMKDDSGEIEVTVTDGRRHLVAKNAKGETVFDGPINTREQMQALPEELRKKVEGVRVQARDGRAGAEAPVDHQ